jgi:hypothetical protein
MDDRYAASLASDNLGAWCAKASGAHSSKGGNGPCGRSMPLKKGEDSANFSVVTSQFTAGSIPIMAHPHVLYGFEWF